MLPSITREPFSFTNNIDACFLSPGSGVSSETQTTLEGTTPSATPRIELVAEQIQVKNTADDVEAIKDILSEMVDMG